MRPGLTEHPAGMKNPAGPVFFLWIGLLPEYPNLAGQHEDYIRQALRAYKSGARKNPIMSGMAAPLTAQDIQELAKYYSSQRPSLCSTDEIRKSGKCPGL